MFIKLIKLILVFIPFLQLAFARIKFHTIKKLFTVYQFDKYNCLFLTYTQGYWENNLSYENTESYLQVYVQELNTIGFLGTYKSTSGCILQKMYSPRKKEYIFYMHSLIYKFCSNIFFFFLLQTSNVWIETNQYAH